MPPLPPLPQVGWSTAAGTPGGGSRGAEKAGEGTEEGRQHRRSRSSLPLSPLPPLPPSPSQLGPRRRLTRTMRTTPAFRPRHQVGREPLAASIPQGSIRRPRGPRGWEGHRRLGSPWWRRTRGDKAAREPSPRLAQPLPVLVFTGSGEGSRGEPLGSPAAPSLVLEKRLAVHGVPLTAQSQLGIESILMRCFGGRRRRRVAPGALAPPLTVARSPAARAALPSSDYPNWPPTFFRM